MPNNKHLRLDDRKLIESHLYDHASFTSIALLIDKDKSTVSKEIRLHLKTCRTSLKSREYNNCVNRFTCEKQYLCSPCKASRKFKKCRSCRYCNFYCTEYVPDTCPRLLKPPYCCNGCERWHDCTLERKVYEGAFAQAKYEETLKAARNGIAASEEEVKYLDSVITPLILKKQSPHYICVHNQDILTISERTLYNWIDKQIFSVRNIDLPMKVRYAARKKTVHVKVEKNCRIDRSYADFLSFMNEFPDFPIVQLDSVEGVKGGKVLLTIHFPKCEFMLCFIREANTARSVNEIIDTLYRILGREAFMKVFKLFLADNGTEFSNPTRIEYDEDKKKRTMVYYCDPGVPGQRGSQERNHEFIRKFIPKGKPMDPYNQDDICLMMDHINSYTRPSLGDRSPYDMFAFMYGQEVLDLLGSHRIPPQEVTLSKSIFRKGGDQQ